MLQIIGWMGCVYLIVKGCELFEKKTTLAYVGAALTLGSAPIFFVLLNAQASPREVSSYSEEELGFNVDETLTTENVVQ